MIKIGCEQEFSFKNARGEYLDFTNSNYQLFSEIVEEFPLVPGDEQVFDCKSLETAPKRCYVEGVERHDESGNLLATDPKGLELRTTPHTNIDELINEFRSSFRAMTHLCKKRGLHPLLISRNPFTSKPSLQVPFNHKELSLRTEGQLNIALRSLLTPGFHINISVAGYDLEQTTDLAEKINYYMPYIIPYTFSSPFIDGKLTEFQSTRNLMRASKRQLTSVDNRKGCHVVEFRGYDPVGQVGILRAILYLTRGLVLDTRLNGRSEQQNAEMLQQVSKHGFSPATVRAAAFEVLNAVKSALGDDAHEVDLLFEMLYSNQSESMRIREKYLDCRDIIESISDMYDF